MSVRTAAPLASTSRRVTFGSSTVETNQRVVGAAHLGNDAADNEFLLEEQVEFVFDDGQGDFPFRLPAGDGLDDADLIPVLDGGVQIVTETNVFFVHENVDEAVQGTVVFEESRLEFGVTCAQVVKHFLDRCSGRVDFIGAVGEFS